MSVFALSEFMPFLSLKTELDEGSVFKFGKKWEICGNFENLNEGNILLSYNFQNVFNQQQ